MELERRARRLFENEGTGPLETEGRMVRITETLEEGQVIRTPLAQSYARVTVKEARHKWTYGVNAVVELKKILEYERGLRPGEY
jgi:hypothetical protein